MTLKHGPCRGIYFNFQPRNGTDRPFEQKCPKVPPQLSEPPPRGLKRQKGRGDRSVLVLAVWTGLRTKIDPEIFGAMSQAVGEKGQADFAEGRRRSEIALTALVMPITPPLISWPAATLFY